MKESFLKKFKDRFWREIEKDDKELERINKMIDRKQTKEVDKWFERWLKEGYFWRDTLGKDKSTEKDWL